MKRQTPLARGLLLSIVLAIFGSWLPVYSMLAQSEKPPVLTEVQKLTIQNFVQALEIDQWRAQQVQQTFEKHRGELAQFLQGVQVPGFTLDLQTLAYTPVDKK